MSITNTNIYLRFMTAYIKSMLLCITLAVLAGNILAQSDVNELKVRAEAGDKAAMRTLADTYFETQNFAQAIPWYEKAAKVGDKKAQTSLGLIYYNGYGVEKNLAAAHKWWTFAALQNDPGAQNDLGNLYFNGEGVEQDYEQAKHWYYEAARRSHVQAQWNLGMMYFDGRGVEKNYPQAYFSIKCAALQGDDEAEAMLKKIAPYLTAEQLKAADAKAKDWLNSGKKMWAELPATVLMIAIAQAVAAALTASDRQAPARGAGARQPSASYLELH
jgi:TPR repeat protein